MNCMCDGGVAWVRRSSVSTFLIKVKIEFMQRKMKLPIEKKSHLRHMKAFDLNKTSSIFVQLFVSND